MKKILFLFISLISSFCLINNILGLEKGKLTITLEDNEYKETILEKIKNKTFSLYKDNLGYATLKFDNDTIVLNDIEYGTYVLKPVSVEGFKSTHYEYRVIIDEYFPDKYFCVNYQPIKGNLIINKYFGSENNYNLDNNSVFEIYKEDKLIKSIKPENGKVIENLEYGNYIIRQVSGEKYYGLSEEFSVNITEEKNYEYNLYSEIDYNLEQTFNEKEEQLSKKEKELLELEKTIKEKEQIYKLEVENKNNEIKKLEEQINQKEIDIIKLKNNITKLENELNNNISLLKQEKLNILDKENIIKKLEEELCLIKSREETAILKTNLIEEPLIVEVPNTSKTKFNISLILISIGSIVLILGIKKVTNH